MFHWSGQRQDLISPCTKLQIWWPEPSGFIFPSVPVSSIFPVPSSVRSLFALSFLASLFSVHLVLCHFVFTVYYITARAGRRRAVLWEGGIAFFFSPSNPHLEQFSSTGKPCLQHSTDLPFWIINFGLFLGWQSASQTGRDLSGRVASLFCSYCQPRACAAFESSVSTCIPVGLVFWWLRTSLSFHKGNATQPSATELLGIAR